MAFFVQGPRIKEKSGGSCGSHPCRSGPTALVTFLEVPPGGGEQSETRGSVALGQALAGLFTV